MLLLFFLFHVSDKDFTFDAQDATTLGVINVRYCGYVVVVKVEGGVNGSLDSSSQQNIELFDQPEGGANALNINRFLNPSMLHTFTRFYNFA